MPQQGDVYLIGGEDRPQNLGAERLRRDGGLHAAIQRARARTDASAFDAGYGWLPG